MADENPMTGTPNVIIPPTLPHTIKTFTYATYNGTNIELDVHLPLAPPTNPVPVVLFFHGGFLVTGHRTLLPSWLLNAYLRRGWIFISADYRCLPESTGLDIQTDVSLAWRWIVDSMPALTGATADPDHMALAGHSGGGWCVIHAAPHLMNPKPKVTLALYPLGDTVGAMRIPHVEQLPHFSVEELAEKLAEIDARVARKQVSPGQRLRLDYGDMFEHYRAGYVGALMQSGRYLDYMTGVRGFGKKVVGEELLGALAGEDEKLKKLFPLEFGGFGKDTSPLILMHGANDELIDVSEIRSFVRRARDLGASVDYHEVANVSHGFDVVNEDVEEETRERTDAEVQTSKTFETFLSHVEA